VLSFASRIIQVASTAPMSLKGHRTKSWQNPRRSTAGRINWRATPAMKKEGTNTERTHNIASNRGIAVLRQASTTAIARDMPDAFAVSNSEWIFSISTVASINEHAYRKREAAESHDVDCLSGHPQPNDSREHAKGIVTITMRELRQSRKNKRTITAVKSAPSALSVIRPLIAFTTNFDWSNSTGYQRRPEQPPSSWGRASRTR